MKIEIKELLKELNGKKVVAIQLPEGLKEQSAEILEQFEKNGNETILFFDTCFGACDLKDNEAKALGANVLVHFGHSKILKKTAVKTIYVPLQYALKEPFLRFCAKKAKLLGFKKIALAAPIQYVPQLKVLEKELKKLGIKSFIGKGSKRIAEKGQVLGCNYSAVHSVEKKADAVIFLGDGVFHAIGLAFSTKKPILVANAVNETCELFSEQEKKIFLRKRFGQIASAKNAESFAIIVGTKKGQMQKAKAFYAKKLIKKSGKKAFIIALDYVAPQNLIGLKADCIINTACPRITTDDFLNFSKPMISVKELEIVFGKRKPESFVMEEIR